MSEVDTKKIFPAQRPDFGRTPWITGALYLEDGRILIADYNNARMFVHDEDGVLLKEILLSGNPRDLTRFRQDLVVLTLPNEIMLQTLDIDTLKLKDGIHVGYECYGITTYDERLVMACGKHLTIMNASWEITETKKIKYGDAVYISSDEMGKLYYTGYKTDALYCVNMDGVLIFAFTSLDLKFCRGISIDYEGNVLVIGRWSHNILVISPEGILKEELMNLSDGLDYPLNVTYRKDSHSKFLILNNNGKNIMICEKSMDVKSSVTIDEQEQNDSTVLHEPAASEDIVDNQEE
ncbi:hypothetical protein FSP39_017633 [Pinctada imbricata]|uniref:Uncharacterized protein n=1 Tax=Pinctada imbricata TaxID=66713 RepID=A0AA88XL96_PINIB|nr:hypothetical protein FSP39_017633 [Pinctada imbricata]